MKEEDFPHRYSRKAWLGADEFLEIAKEKFPGIELAIIAYSVRYGYTPVEFKYLGDELLTKLSEMVR